MELAYFLHVDGPAGRHEKLQTWADEVYGPALHRSDQADSVEAFAPKSASDPYLGTESGKLLIVQANFASKAELEAAVAHPAVAQALEAMPQTAGIQVTAEAFSIHPCPLSDGSTPPRRAPLSFVVRYYRPVEREREFTDYYLAHHPPILARFPAIRNVFCYLPVEWTDASAVNASGSFLGNEIVFDSVDDLNAALASEVRHELRADYRKFPPHAGAVTHHAMQRRVLYPGSAD